MPQDRSEVRSACRAALLRTTRAAAFAALVVCANAGVVRAGDDDESILSRIERTIGLKNPNTMQYGINYSERSPLVVPPTRDLPPPRAAAPPPVADWPKDPDIAKRDKAKAEDKVVPHADTVVESGRVLRPDELNQGGAGRTASSGSSSGGTSTPPDDRYSNSNSKKSFFNLDWMKKEQYTTFTGEPARTSLTEPPPGYLTPSPDQPYGVGRGKTQTAHVPTPSEHGEVQR